MSEESTPRLSVIIAATPRSGSYLLCDLLHATGYLPLADEWLTDVGMDRLRMAYGLPADTPWPVLRPELLKRERNAEGRFAIKTVWEQFRDAVTEVTGAASEELPRAAATVFPNPKYIWIRRRDRLGQCVSWVKAEQTGQWRRGQTDDSGDCPLLFSAHDIFRHRVFLHLAESGWAHFFDHAESRPHIVFYEDLVADPQATMSGICAFLDLPDPPPVELPGKPQRDAINAEWKQRFSDLEDSKTLESGPAPPLGGALCEVPETLEMKVGEVRLISVGVHNRSDTDWLPRLTESGFKGAVVQVEGIGSEPTCGEAHARIAAGHTATIPVRLVAPSEAGNHTLRWALHPDSQCPIADPLVAPQTRLIVTEAPEVAAAKRFFGRYAAVSTGWQELPWLGYFLDGWFPWIYHQDHRWWFIDDEGWQDDEIRIHDVHLGWLRTSPARSPNLLRESDGHELRLLRRNDESRAFENLTTGERFSAPTCLFEHITNKDPRKVP